MTGSRSLALIVVLPLLVIHTVDDIRTHGVAYAAATWAITFIVATLVMVAVLVATNWRNRRK